jgi:amidase
LRRSWFFAGLFAFALTSADARSPPFNVVEVGIPKMREALARNRVTSRELVQQYLTRIAAYEDRLHAAITVNPHALDEADALDRERARGHIRGPLHGIPIALKDNIQTMDMRTTGGALAFEHLMPPYEATLAKNLRAAGAIIIAKTQMTELANWVAGPPTQMPGNYNSVNGFGYNPYDPRRDPRPDIYDGRPVMPTGGSSSGIGTSANFWVANVGTETSGSILNPANWTMLVGIKPTVGRVSRYGVIPITADQDSPGPMAKTVTDAAIMLGVLEGAPDANDPATVNCPRPPRGDYTQFLHDNGLRGARIGIPRAFFYDPVAAPGEPIARGGLMPDQMQAMQDAITVMKSLGATIVDPADIPSVIDPDPDSNFLLWGICGQGGEARGFDDKCTVAFKYGMKRDFNGWLRSLGERAPVKSLTELRQWNLAHESGGTLKYGQLLLDLSDEMDLDRDRARYEADSAKDVRLAGTHGIDQVMKRERLDALLFPAQTGANIAARARYPSVIVPFALVANVPDPPLPEGFDAKPAPFGVTFTGMACSEPRLIELAYAFEQATRRRIPPVLN